MTSEELFHLHLNIYIIILGIGLFILMLSLLFCCYMSRYDLTCDPPVTWPLYGLAISTVSFKQSVPDSKHQRWMETMLRTSVHIFQMVKQEERDCKSIAGNLRWSLEVNPPGWQIYLRIKWGRGRILPVKISCQFSDRQKISGWFTSCRARVLERAAGDGTRRRAGAYTNLAQFKFQDCWLQNQAETFSPGCERVTPNPNKPAVLCASQTQATKEEREIQL